MFCYHIDIDIDKRIKFGHQTSFVIRSAGSYTVSLCMPLPQQQRFLLALMNMGQDGPYLLFDFSTQTCTFSDYNMFIE